MPAFLSKVVYLRNPSFNANKYKVRQGPTHRVLEKKHGLQLLGYGMTDIHHEAECFGFSRLLGPVFVVCAHLKPPKGALDACRRRAPATATVAAL
jgi:hypothetical protein